MIDIVQPFVFVTFVWWLSTGLIIILDRRAVSTRVMLFGSGLLAAGSLYCLTHITLLETTTAAYSAFVCAIFIWGWVEVSFLSGWITGPRKQALLAGTIGKERFNQAVAAVLYHELLIVLTGFLIAWISWGQPNRVALWTFLVLWIMRTSAKLNLFLGVRNTGSELLPDRVSYLGSFFRRRKMNWLFPFSILGSLIGTIVLLWQAAYSLQVITSNVATQSAWWWLNQALVTHSQMTQVGVTGLVLVAALLVLAMLEHWFMILPFDANTLLGWSKSNHLPPDISDTSKRETHDPSHHHR